MEIVNIILDILVYAFAFYGCICLLSRNSNKKNEKKSKKEEERKEVK